MPVAFRSARQFAALPKSRVLDAADREGQVDLQRADLGVHLVRGREVDLGQLREDLVPLRDVALVQLVVGLDGLARDAVQLVQRRLELPGGDLLVVEGKGCHVARSPLSTSG
jgi:hypothetical protein